jgi:hypothetical protein
MKGDIAEALASSNVQAWLNGGEGSGDLPARFEALGGDDKNVVVIRDIETGRQTEIPVFAWPATRKALDNLFG